MKNTTKTVATLAAAAIVLMSSCAIDQQPQSAAPKSAARRHLAVSPCDDITQRRFAVIRVIDGDTLTILYDGEQTSCRLAGIDAPELRDQGGAESRQSLKRLVNQAGGLVVISFPARRKRDHFGRLLVSARSTRGVDLGRAMIRIGMAKPRTID